ncbi:short-chain dehydrogenase [Curtobacterium sp. MCJR17_055]|uniref:SDR family NAD(P)-dependent oxidoreductase n=1 Tax=unclassified Curtobacterium TaxID=257496 RepID=UPI000D8224D0|nr:MULTISPECIES: SDR family NAD(P)-dependent oxidoreductase [unclassified Curtobacterium]PYY36993.1 short-chain dehydrogenase [Curtobacterium sp. MCBD17_029]PYY58919.1 short-chain dehydrogenase [Curtobacterium sp. MCJR17_055]PYY59918.1 short-chain dehydrogenase [Curtobacterium sp. MCPF17_015]PZE87975.1 short-chain dehydrogenase [Curtobacterium sp. MCBD17_008]
MTTTLITGGNKGIGYETARRLIAAGHTVWIGARSADRGRPAADELGASFVQLDVTDDASVVAAAATVRDQAGHLDVLINNAGILGDVNAPEDMTVDQLRAVYETNVFGVVRVTNAFLPVLRRSTEPSVINVTSGLGSFTMIHDPERVESQYPLAAYGSSKTAVTMLTMQYAKTTRDVRFNAVDPGQTATEFTGHLGHSVADGADAAVRIATLGADTPTGTVTDRDGTLPW